MDGIVRHETRERWNPGAGGMCCHSIALDPDEPERMYVGISAAGVFRSEDGGETFAPANRGTAADFLPDPFPELGQCVHKLLVHPARPERLWQQNHCGVYRSDDRGESWERLEGNGLPSGFGFPLALDHRDPDAAFVVPEESSENRVTPDGRLGVYRTRDGGSSWELLTDGLPEPAWGAVMREGFASDRLDPAGIYLGTQSGSLFVSPDAGETWLEAASQLPPILSVEASAWWSSSSPRCSPPRPAGATASSWRPPPSARRCGRSRWRASSWTSAAPCARSSTSTSTASTPATATAWTRR